MQVIEYDCFDTNANTLCNYYKLILGTHIIKIHQHFAHNTVQYLEGLEIKPVRTVLKSSDFWLVSRLI